MPISTNILIKLTVDTRKAATAFSRLAVQLRDEPLAGPVPTVAPNPRPRLSPPTSAEAT